MTSCSRFGAERAFTQSKPKAKKSAADTGDVKAVGPEVTQSAAAKKQETVCSSSSACCFSN